MEFVKISYQQLQENNYLSEYNDKYSLAAFIDDNVRNTFLSNPNNDDNSKTAILFAVDNGDIVGRSIIYGTSIKYDSQIIKVQSFGSIEVDNTQRGKGIGTSISKYSLNNNEYSVFMCSLLSPSCYSIMRKPENACTIFDFPEYVKVINTESAFACRGFKGFPLKTLKTLGNIAISIFNIPNKLRTSRLKKVYTIQKETKVPEWAGEMCLNDGHKYAEYHDTKWLQWCLDYNLSGHNEDIQSFYCIYNKQNQPVGFFMTKERRRLDIKQCRMINGTICEWASIDKNLSETDINLLALDTFSKDCYRILTITDSSMTEKQLRRMGFIKHGYMQMGFRDKLNQFPDMKDMSLWRIRFGCCNSILY
jgi:hypothetical protein